MDLRELGNPKGLLDPVCLQKKEVKRCAFVLAMHFK